jgi:hypothetical protein
LSRFAGIATGPELTRVPDGPKPAGIADSAEPARVPDGPKPAGIADLPPLAWVADGAKVRGSVEVVGPPDAAEPAGIPDGGESPGIANPPEPAGVPGGPELTGVPGQPGPVRFADLAELAGVALAARQFELVAGSPEVLRTGGILPPCAAGKRPWPSAGPGVIGPRTPRTRKLGTLGVPGPAIAAPPRAAHLCLPVQSLSAEPDVQSVDPCSLAPIVPGGYAPDRANHATERIP